VIVLAIVGYFVSPPVGLSSLNSELEEAVQKDAGYTESIIKVETEASTISYKELFDLCEKSIEGRTNLIVQLRGLYPETESELKNKLIEFLNAENELVRQKSQFYRKQLAFSSSFDLYKAHLENLPSSYYGWDYWEKSSKELKSEMEKAASDMTQSADCFVSTYKTLVENESVLKRSMELAGLRFVGFFEKYQQSNIRLAEDAKTLAQAAQL
jgi:hypothetical protein